MRGIRRAALLCASGVVVVVSTTTVGAAPAGAAVSAELREFLRFVTGVRAEYMQLDDVADSALAPAAPLLAELSDAQFNDLSHVDVGLVSADAEELIRSWT